MLGQENIDPCCQAALYAPWMELDKWVKAARMHAKLSQEALGDRLGVGKANVSHWETGKHEPSFRQLLKIAELSRFPLLDMDIATPPETIKQALQLLGRAIARTPSERSKALKEGLAGLVDEGGAEYRQASILAVLQAAGEGSGEPGAEQPQREPAKKRAA